MAVFTTIGRGDLERLLALFDCGSLEDFAGIPAGIVNTNYEVRTVGRRFVLTLFERLAASGLGYFLSLLSHLRRAGVPCAAPVAARDGTVLHVLGARPAVLFEWVDGAAVDHPAPGDCAQVGEALAGMHRAARDFRLTRTSDYALPWLQRSCARLQPRFAPVLQADLGRALQAARKFAAAGLPRGTIHGDLFRDNVLFRDGRLAGMIDFYYACTDFLSFDLAVAANDWCVDDLGELDAARTGAMLEAYHAVRPLTAAEREAWPLALQTAAAQFLLSRLLDSQFPRAGELLRPKSPAEFGRILRARLRAGNALREVWPRGAG